jgi:ATP-binding cassette subfamily C exporter for protease/lipase
VGPSGAGKSTLARCIIGIWPNVTGRVLLDGQDISTWSRDELGPHLGYLPQDIELFEGTIAENIGRFGDLKPEWVIEAAQRTGIHEMVLRFPKGYDTPMGEAGGMLSGGQRQRVGLARAIYGNPAMVVLDEPNANLDDLGEAALIKAVKDLRDQGRTVFMVVHQQNILSVADRVLVLNEGVIKQFGQLAVTPAVAAPQA